MSNASRRLAVALLIAIGGAAAVLGRPSVVQAAPPQMVRWEILATVTYVTDPLGLFPDVRLGDPVRGMLKYDISLFPNPLYSTMYEHYFTNETWVDVTRMVIENPRNGTEFAFLTDIDGDYADVDVLNDFPGENGPFDGFLAQQSVIPPVGYLGPSPVIAVVFEGPPNIIPGAAHYPTIDDRPPGQLNLEDWPIAGMAFWDAYAEDPSATGIEAEIYSLTPVIEPHRSGDYNYDGDVDNEDYTGWRLTYGEYGDWYQHYADGNGDDSVDAADYVLWRKNLGAGMNVNSEAAVPEPTSVLLLTLAAVGVPTGRRWYGGRVSKLVRA